ncbi:hypothetical protein GWI33_006055 [Rhynchophorus ferrugineus]|uniref:Uncharacterized protein n=1 Tax=Rhynchophorus ferrugineus TaxID=354439 RepID=A0A834IUJ6_RHYFE|nr:hypothetical protein GWI33_006055 [Rhynchophorus ferrugineus]
MAFVCPTKEETQNLAHMAANIKKTLQDVEKSLTVSVKPICVPCCVPLCEYPQEITNGNGKNPPKNSFDPPKVMVCYREPLSKSKAKEGKAEKEEGIIRLQQSKSRELRASILYTGCQCEKRDGLQDDCPRTGCHGSPECLTSPPTCGPSEFCDGKHLLKKNKYHDRNGSKSKKESDKAGSGKNESAQPKARYKCFAATVDPPIVCCPPCVPIL